MGYLLVGPFKDTLKDALAELASLPKLRILNVLVSKRGGYRDLERGGYPNFDKLRRRPSFLTFPEGKNWKG